MTKEYVFLYLKIQSTLLTKGMENNSPYLYTGYRPTYNVFMTSYSRHKYYKNKGSVNIHLENIYLNFVVKFYLSKPRKYYLTPS